jgi:hypothetical protein
LKILPSQAAGFSAASAALLPGRMFVTTVIEELVPVERIAPPTFGLQNHDTLRIRQRFQCLHGSAGVA